MTPAWLRVPWEGDLRFKSLSRPACQASQAALRLSARRRIRELDDPTRLCQEKNSEKRIIGASRTRPAHFVPKGVAGFETERETFLLPFQTVCASDCERICCCNQTWVLKNSIFLKIAKIWGDRKCLGKLRKSFVGYPDAILFLIISRPGVFQRAFTPTENYG